MHTDKYGGALESNIDGMLQGAAGFVAGVPARLCIIAPLCVCVCVCVCACACVCVCVCVCVSVCM